YLLISNTLRFICSILLALAFYFILHIARHTFASLAIANKVSLESIAKMLGHTDIRTTRIYAKIMNSTIANEMKVLQNKFAI
ncbi:tyrosine-type recombinase/integrase, partial [Phocaeicola vulgatus]|uniref:tyrosine-type recombinase/integrase n=1 Tax=Phocaeicola vulgatus TaxID=821 RepID=UPI0032E3F5A8